MLGQPFDCHRAAESLLGLTPVAVRMLSGVIVATSPEADQLVDEMPGLVRSLSIATTAFNERLYGEIRGPVIWSETMAARASSAGNPQIFVCASSKRAYDTSENRVLVAALRTIVEAARLVEKQGLRRRNTELARHVRENGALAARYRDHRALNSVSKTPDRRDLRRTRSGRSHRTYEPAMDMLAVADAPITAAHVAALADARTDSQHAALVAVIETLRARGHDVPAPRVTAGLVQAGPVTYVHDGSHLRTSLPPGIHVGDLLLDVAVDAAGDLLDGTVALEQLAARAGGRSCAVLAGPGDLAWALDRDGAFPDRRG